MTDILDPAETFEAAYAAADALRRERRIDVALDAFLALTDRLEAEGTADQLEKAGGQALNCAVRLKRWDLAETTARRLLARRPDFALAHVRLGEALIAAGRLDDAKAALARALALDPDDGEARVLSHIAEAPAPRAPRAGRTRAWPVRQAAFDDPADLIRRYLLRGMPTGGLAIGPDTRFVTVGSCFAHSLGKRLAGAGHKVSTEVIGEEVNSPLANARLFAWIETGPHDQAGKAMERLFGAEVHGRLREALAAADVVVLTLGVAPAFFDAESGDFVFLPNDSSTARDFLQDRCVMRTTTVAENVAAIGAVLGAVDRMSGGRARVALTVSPVPLAGTTEFDSAVVADCLSKSTLRLACHEALASPAGVNALYWPSFEIVRWLGGHLSAGTPPAFGADDGNTRHVSRWLVKLIVRLFLEHFARDRPEEAAVA